MIDATLAARVRALPVPAVRASRRSAAVAAFFAFWMMVFAAPQPACADADDAPAAAENADPAGRPAQSRQREVAPAEPAETPALRGDDGEQVDALTRVQTAGFLRVGVYRNFTPFHEDDSGGIDDDIGAELARRLGVRVSVQSYMAGDEMEDDFRNILWKGHYLGLPTSDVMLHVPTDAALARSSPQVRILAPYASEQTVVACDGEHLSDWKGMESLGSLSAGVETQSMPDLYLMSFGGQYKSQIRHFPALHQAVAALKSGALEVVIGSRTKLESALGKDQARYPRTRFNGGIYGKSLELGLAVKKGEDKLASALAQAVADMRADGSFQRIYARHDASWVAPDQASEN